MIKSTASRLVSTLSAIVAGGVILSPSGLRALEITDFLDVRTDSNNPTKLELRADGVLVGKGVFDPYAAIQSSDCTAAPTFLWFPSRSALYIGQTSSTFSNSLLGSHSVAFGGSSGSSAPGYSAFSAMGSHANGQNSIALSGSNASGDLSFAASYSTATGDSSIAIGIAYSLGFASTAIGPGTSSGDFAVSLGTSVALGVRSFAVVGGTATSYNSIAMGRYNVGGGDPTNWIATDPLFELGNGASSTQKSNALTVYKNGNATFAGVVRVAPGGDIPMFGQ